MQQPPAPEARDLLPPLLACLPTTFVSARPPPALLPLLAPILRQRLTYLASDAASNRDGWVRLLCWDAQQAATLPPAIEKLDLEPHPVSGEVEIDDVRGTEYRRLDDETLHARLQVDQFNLLPIYVWCKSDEHGHTGPGWKLTELKVLANAEDGEAWCDTISEANDAYGTSAAALPPRTDRTQASAQDDTDDSYWAAYDQTPAQTPALKRSPAPHVPLGSQSQAQTDDDYYARYGAEVQPAMDAHDPDEEHPETESESQHRSRRPISLEITAAMPAAVDADRPAWQKALYPHPVAHDSAVATSLSRSMHSELNMPRPISPASSTRSVERLEEQAAVMSDDDNGSTRFAMGTKQHISTEVKSLFRLAKSAGMSRRDFEELIKRELDVLSLLDDDE